MEKHDIVIIGAGPGGYPAAIRAAQLGASVALIEKEFPGGTCLNWGCIPTKTLIADAALLWNMRHPGRPGLGAGDISFDYAAMIERKDQVVQKLRGGIESLLKANGIKLIEGTASFAGRNRITARTNSGGDIVLESSQTVIAAGASAALPEFLPKSPRVLDSRAFLDIRQMPPSLIVLGGGVIGCELACLAARLGARVAIVELLEDILVSLDKDVRTILRRHMERELRIEIVAGRPAESVVAGRDGVKLTSGGRTLEADLLLAAVGRRPATSGLGLDKAGLAADAKGCIPVDGNGLTRAASVYAVGDVTDGPQLAHAATAQGLAAVEHALGRRRATRKRSIPCCIFTAPEIGAVGLSEREAAGLGREVIIGKFPFLALGRALAAGETLGFVKLIADADSGQALGAQAVGAHATELIAEAALAIDAELTLRDIARAVHAHPTLAEAWMEAANAALGQCVHAAPKHAMRGKETSRSSGDKS